MANISEIRYQVGEAWKGAYNSATIYSKAAVVQDATGLSVYRSLKSGNVGHALTDTEWWKVIIDLSSIKAESDTLDQLNIDVAAAEALRVQAESDRVSAESSRATAELERIRLEGVRESNETQRGTNEDTRTRQENSRVSAETLRVQAESDRVLAEDGRVASEGARGRAETDRQTAETNRAGAEADRVSAEAGRASAETLRVQAESGRVSAETLRVQAESDRVLAESGRASAEEARGTAYTTAEGSESGSTAGDGSRWGSYKTAENNRGTAYTEAEGTSGSTAGDGSRWGAYKTAEGDETESEAGDGSRWGAFMSAEVARNAIVLTYQPALFDGFVDGVTEQQQSITDPDGVVFDTSKSYFLAYENVGGLRKYYGNWLDVKNYQTGMHGSPYSGKLYLCEDDGYVYLWSDGELRSVGDGLVGALESGRVVPMLARNLENWEDTENSVLYRQEDVVDTAGGTASINSAVAANLMVVAAKTDFSAQTLLATGFNLLHHATAIGSGNNTGYYFLVPKLEFGTYGTADKPNGILFTDNNGNNLTPTVYFKPLSSGVPTSVTDGTVCAYTNSNGHRFYTTSQAGYIIVSGITFANTCAHIGWSKRYDEFISPTDASDAGATVAIASGINALHSYGLMLTAGSVSDRIEYEDATHITWHRLVERVAANTLTWTDTLQEDGTTYLHEASISGMKADGAAEFMTENITLGVSGTTVSFTDQNATVTSTDYIKYELAAEVTGTATVSSSFAVEDWGLIVITGASGEAYFDIAYGQNMPDALREFVSTGRDTLQASIDALEYEVENTPAYDPDEQDLESLPMLCGQPMKLYAAGAPAEANVPTNWIQFADGGYNWTGLPSAIGQEYIDTTNGKKYEAVINNATTRTLKWLAV